MREHILGVVMASAMVWAASSAAQDREIGYPAGSLAYNAMVDGDYARAEQQLRRDNRVDRNDPARLINLGQALAKTGRGAEAAILFAQAMRGEEIELVLADGRVMSSREAARRALMTVKAR